MPLDYARDDARRLIVATATDTPQPVSVQDTMAVIERQWSEGTWDYALLYDYRHTSHVTTDEEARLLAQCVENVSHGVRRGPVGLAVGTSGMVRRATAYAEFTARVQEFELLITEAQIADWLRRNVKRS